MGYFPQTLRTEGMDSVAEPAQRRIDLPFLFLSGASLLLLWFRLIQHLRVEWSVNPQYTYGWAVPFLCVFLAWRSWRRNGAAGGADAALDVGREGWGRLGGALAGAAALLYGATRLVQEANPEWRLVSWALALEVLVLTVFLLRLFPDFTFRASPFTLHPSRSLPALLFFLVAVPWPTLLEGPLTQGLARANAAATAELLGWAGVPALRHGNVIEVASGVVGIDAACSGIRSLQATFMLSLFFGEFYRLSPRRRLGLCLAGFACSFLFNVVRTTLLSSVAAGGGMAAVAAWHDPAGGAILLASFICLWLLARRLRKAASAQEKMNCGAAEWECRGRLPCRTESARGRRACRAAGLLIWLLCVELGVEAWYRRQEHRLAAPVTWTLELPARNPTFQNLPLAERTRQFLRYDEAANAAWDADGWRWQAMFFCWKPGRTAVHLVKGHTPEVCLSAAGNRLTAQSEVRVLRCQDLNLPVRFYSFQSPSGPLHVVYCLWRDRAPGQSFGADRLSYRNRLEPVLRGTRLTGQRSLEVALWGCADQQQAEAALADQLQRLVRRL